MENSHQPPLRWQCTWHAGPDAGAVHTFGPGSHVLGRAAHATLTADDPALAPHHAVLEVGPDGRGTLTQLAGGPPIRVDGAAMNGGGDGPVELAAGAWLEVGTSLLRLQRGGEPLADGAVHLHCGAVVRSARAVSQWTPQLAVTPDPPGPGDERAGGLLPALAGVAASGVLALVLRQPTFILFGLLGASGATFLGTIAIGGMFTNLFLLSLVLTGAYVGLLATVQKQALERRTKVRYLDEPAPVADWSAQGDEFFEDEEGETYPVRRFYAVNGN